LIGVMPAMSPSEFPHALARKWAEDFAEHLCLAVGLRELGRCGAPTGALRAPLTARAVALLEAADQLAAFGIRPSHGLGGAEGELWALTVRYAGEVPWLVPPGGASVEELAEDLDLLQRAWDRFRRAVAEMPADLC